MALSACRSKLRDGLGPERDRFRAELEVILDPAELEAVVSRLGDFRGHISVSKLWRWLGLDPPADHVDPSLRELPLPEPYRTLDAVVRHEVFDQAWEDIRVREEAETRRRESAGRSVNPSCMEVGGDSFLATTLLSGGEVAASVGGTAGEPLLYVTHTYSNTQLGRVRLDPVRLDPVGGDPVGGDPVGGDPVGGDPVGGDPVGGGPVGGGPVGGEEESSAGPCGAWCGPCLRIGPLRAFATVRWAAGCDEALAEVLVARGSDHVVEVAVQGRVRGARRATLAPDASCLAVSCRDGSVHCFSLRRRQGAGKAGARSLGDPFVVVPARRALTDAADGDDGADDAAGRAPWVSWVPARAVPGEAAAAVQALDADRDVRAAVMSTQTRRRPAAASLAKAGAGGCSLLGTVREEDEDEDEEEEDGEDEGGLGAMESEVGLDDNSGGGVGDDTSARRSGLGHTAELLSQASFRASSAGMAPRYVAVCAPGDAACLRFGWRSLRAWGKSSAAAEEKEEEKEEKEEGSGSVAALKPLHARPPLPPGMEPAVAAAGGDTGGDSKGKKGKGKGSGRGGADEAPVSIDLFGELALFGGQGGDAADPSDSAAAAAAAASERLVYGGYTRRAPERAFPPHTPLHLPAGATCFTADGSGRCLLVGAADGSAMILDAVLGVECCALCRHVAAVGAVAFCTADDNGGPASGGGAGEEEEEAEAAAPPPPPLPTFAVVGGRDGRVCHYRVRESLFAAPGAGAPGHGGGRQAPKGLFAALQAGSSPPHSQAGSEGRSVASRATKATARSGRTRGGTRGRRGSALRDGAGAPAFQPGIPPEGWALPGERGARLVGWQDVGEAVTSVQCLEGAPIAAVATEAADALRLFDLRYGTPLARLEVVHGGNGTVDARGVVAAGDVFAWRAVHGEGHSEWEGAGQVAELAFSWDVLCAAYPELANACGAGPNPEGAAKKLFLLTSPEQREAEGAALQLGNVLTLLDAPQGLVRSAQGSTGSVTRGSAALSVRSPTTSGRGTTRPSARASAVGTESVVSGSTSRGGSTAVGRGGVEGSVAAKAPRGPSIPQPLTGGDAPERFAHLRSQRRATQARRAYRVVKRQEVMLEALEAAKRAGRML